MSRSECGGSGPGRGGRGAEGDETEREGYGVRRWRLWLPIHPFDLSSLSFAALLSHAASSSSRNLFSSSI